MCDILQVALDSALFDSAVAEARALPTAFPVHASIPLDPRRCSSIELGAGSCTALIEKRVMRCSGFCASGGLAVPGRRARAAPGASGARRPLSCSAGDLRVARAAVEGAGGRFGSVCEAAWCQGGGGGEGAWGRWRSRSAPGVGGERRGGADGGRRRLGGELLGGRTQQGRRGEEVTRQHRLRAAAAEAAGDDQQQRLGTKEKWRASDGATSFSEVVVLLRNLTQTACACSVQSGDCDNTAAETHSIFFCARGFVLERTPFSFSPCLPPGRLL